jgi:hypothetical protein
MSILSRRQSTPGISPSGFEQFSRIFAKVFINRTASTIWLTGLAALIAGFRLATQGGTEGDEMFRDWMIAWGVIWFALAGVSLRLLKPLYDFFVTDQIAQLDAFKVKQMRSLQPNFDQELRSLGLYQQMRDEKSPDKRAR